MTTAPLEHLSHTYADDGDYTVRVTFRDDNGPFVTRELTITVKNVMPTLTVAANQTINESDDLVLPVIGSFTDPGFDNPLNPNPPVLPLIANPTAESFAYFIDWGDGRDQIGTMSAADINGAVGVLSTGSFGAAHNYADDGVYVVTVRLADDNMAAFSTAAMFLNGANGVDFVQQTFTVTVLNVAPSFVPVGGQPILGDDINTQGITTIHVLFSDPGYDNPLNPNTVAVGNPLAETFTYVVNWGDGTIDTIAVTFVSGTPMVVNAQTSVLASNRVSGSANVLTTGGFDVSHRYLGPPDPLNPTADITITLTLIDDNGGSVTASVSVGNPGIDTTNVAIDTTPEVPRLEFVAMAAPQGILDQPSATIAGLQSGDFRATSGFLSATSERYLMLVVIAPDGSEIESHRLSDEALSDLRGLFATLPDGRYKVFLVRTDNNTKRLVIEVYVRRGRVIDPSDKSEDTRDRPPTSETEIQAVPLDQNPLLERIPNQDQLEEVEPDDNQQGDRQSSNEVRPTADDETYMPTAAALRWATPVVGLALMAGRDRWSKQLDAAFEQADERDWNRLRRRGHTGRWWRRETEQPGPRMRPSNYTR
jgi:PKD repeat protein